MYEKKLHVKKRVKNRPEGQKTDFFKKKQTILGQNFAKGLLNRPRSVKTDRITTTAKGL